MSKKNVLVLFGGDSPEHDISKSSAETVMSNMDDEKYSIIPVYINRDGRWFLYDGHTDNKKNIQWERLGTPAALSPSTHHKGLLRIVGDKVKNIPVDVIFPVLHGINGEDGTMQGLFTLSGIPYVGCGLASSAIAMDKAFTKQIVASVGVQQADYLVYMDYEFESSQEIWKKIRQKIGYPCFVKPANAGSSVGISKAGNKKELEAAVALALMYDRKIIVEKAVKGRELECGVLGSGGPDTEASVVGEVLAAAEFYNYDAKYNNSESKTVVPADLPAEVSETIRRAAVDIFKAVDGSGLARVDFFVEEKTNRIVFNEINTMPGFTSISMYPMMWEASGLPLPELIDRLIEIGLSTQRR